MIQILFLRLKRGRDVPVRLLASILAEKRLGEDPQIDRDFGSFHVNSQWQPGMGKKPEFRTAKLAFTQMAPHQDQQFSW